jgi:septal ring factor EnvC (AmiA/AmiB activator)
LKRATPKLQRRALLTALILGAALAATLPPGTGVFAQPATPADAELEKKKRELEEMQKKAKSLQSDVDALAAERARLNDELVKTGADIKSTEADLTSIETRLGELEVQEKILRGSLNERHDHIAKLLSALQRMGRNPPPILITQREDALQMVRSGMLLAATFPELGAQAQRLSGQVNELVRVMTEMRAKGEQLRARMTQLSESHTRLRGLIDKKQALLDERQSELQRMRAAAEEAARATSDPNVLIARMDDALRKNTGLGAYDEQRRKEAEAKMAAAGEPPLAAPPSTEPGKDGEQVATLPVPGKPSNVVAPPPGSALGKPGRIEPEIPFVEATGRLPLPAHGRKVLRFGEKTQFGGQSKGIVLETRQGAQVTSPCDGWIVYAGEFRSYGQLLIINAGDGYHVLLAGLSQIDVQPGQFVLAAEPVGTMSGWSQQVQPASASSAPVLYIEFRKGGTPIDPDPWWVPDLKKVQE